jgi:4'-phosphopantetheinyl transferase
METAGTAWTTPLGRLSLPPGDVHVWLVPTPPPDFSEENLQTLVSLAEVQGCLRMVKHVDRRRFLSVRGALRRILGTYLKAPPSGISIAYSSSGKPLLDDHRGRRQTLHFNVSHAADIALVAVSHGLRVGVDVERVREVQARDEILSDFFSPAEQSLAVSPAHSNAAFFQVWTRREAASKAVGMGLMESFLCFSLPAAQHSPRGFRLTLPDSAKSRETFQDWWVRDLDPVAGHAGALCVEEENPEPAFWRFSW